MTSLGWSLIIDGLRLDSKLHKVCLCWWCHILDIFFYLGKLLREGGSPKPLVISGKEKSSILRRVMPVGFCQICSGLYLWKCRRIIIRLHSHVPYIPSTRIDYGSSSTQPKPTSTTISLALALVGVQRIGEVIFSLSQTSWYVPDHCKWFLLKLTSVHIQSSEYLLLLENQTMCTLNCRRTWLIVDVTETASPFGATWWYLVNLKNIIELLVVYDMDG